MVSINDQQEYMSTIEKSKKILFQILDSPRFDYQITKFLKFYDFELDSQKIIKKLKELLPKNILCLAEISQYGMIGPNTKIYLHFTMIEEYMQKKEEIKAVNMFIATIIHEIGHLVVRLIQDNSFSLTPRKEKKEEQWEAGYILELMVFGVIIMEIDEEGILSLEETWKNLDGPIFSDFSILKQKMKYKDNNFFRSGYNWIEPQR